MVDALNEQNEATLNEAKETNWRTTVVNKMYSGLEWVRLKQNPTTSVILYHIINFYDQAQQCSEIFLKLWIASQNSVGSYQALKLFTELCKTLLWIVLQSSE